MALPILRRDWGQFKPLLCGYVIPSLSFSPAFAVPSDIFTKYLPRKVQTQHGALYLPHDAFRKATLERGAPLLDPKGIVLRLQSHVEPWMNNPGHDYYSAHMQDIPTKS